MSPCNLLECGESCFDDYLMTGLELFWPPTVSRLSPPGSMALAAATGDGTTSFLSFLAVIGSFGKDLSRLRSDGQSEKSAKF